MKPELDNGKVMFETLHHMKHEKTLITNIFSRINCMLMVWRVFFTRKTCASSKFNYIKFRDALKSP